MISLASANALRSCRTRIFIRSLVNGLIVVIAAPIVTGMADMAKLLIRHNRLTQMLGTQSFGYRVFLGFNHDHPSHSSLPPYVRLSRTDALRMDADVSTNQRKMVFLLAAVFVYAPSSVSPAICTHAVMLAAGTE